MANPPDITVEQFATLLNGRGRLLGLDLGTKTIGLAISDSNWSISSAVKTIRRTKFTADVKEMMEFATSEKVEGFVLGLPLNMDGSEGPRVQATRAFARNLSQHTDLPLMYWDERLSSFTAEQYMLEADLSRKKRAKSIDHVAASIILQGCIDALAEVRDRLKN